MVVPGCPPARPAFPERSSVNSLLRWLGDPRRRQQRWRRRWRRQRRRRRWQLHSDPVKAHRSRQEAPADRSGAKAHQRAASGARQRPSLYASGVLFPPSRCMPSLMRTRASNSVYASSERADDPQKRRLPTERGEATRGVAVFFAHASNPRRQNGSENFTAVFFAHASNPT